MAQQHDQLMRPEIEGLLEKTDSKFKLVTLSSQRARQINSYFGQLGDGLGSSVPPQITSTARKALSIAFEEIGAEVIVPMLRPEEPEIDETGEDDDSAE
ncbi:MAG: DNA-directed RNA polymerase subunit omega [Acidimicrobiales bacterium]